MWRVGPTINDDNIVGGFIGQKYILNRSMYELKLVRLLRLSLYGERSRYLVRSRMEDT